MRRPRDRLPYFDFLFDQLAKNNALVERAFGNNVHWGYWESPEKADTSAVGFSQASENLNLELLRELDIEEGNDILDVGCGFGGTMATLDRLYQGVHVTGLNIDPRQISRARQALLPKRKASNSVEFIVGDACRLPFPDCSFDHIAAVECIFHFPDREIFFKEACRVLRPGGRLVLSDFISTGKARLPLLLLFLTHGWSFMKIYGVGFGRPPTVVKYLELAGNSGFDALKVRDINRNTLPTYQFLSRFAQNFSGIERRMKRGNRFLEMASRSGAMTYQILVLNKRLRENL